VGEEAKARGVVEGLEGAGESVDGYGRGVPVGVDSEPVPALEGRHRGDPAGQLRPPLVGPGLVPFADEERLALDLLEGEATVEGAARPEHRGVAEAPVAGGVVPVRVGVCEVHVAQGRQERGIPGPVAARHRDLHSDLVAQVPLHLEVVAALDVHKKPGDVIGPLLEVHVALRHLNPIVRRPFAEHLFQPSAVGFERDGLGEEVVLVGELHQGDGRVILVRQLRVRVHVRPQVLGELFLQLDELRVEVGVGLRAGLELVHRIHPVSGLEVPVHELVEVDVDALLLEAVHQVVEAVEVLGIELAGVVDIPSEEVPLGPDGVGMVGADDVDAEASQTPGDLLRLLVGWEVGAGGEARAPEAHLLARVCEDEPAVPRLHETELPRGLVVEEGDIHRRAVPGERVGDPVGGVGLRDGP